MLQDSHSYYKEQVISCLYSNDKIKLRSKDWTLYKYITVKQVMLVMIKFSAFASWEEARNLWSHKCISLSWMPTIYVKVQKVHSSHSQSSRNSIIHGVIHTQVVVSQAGLVQETSSSIKEGWLCTFSKDRTACPKGCGTANTDQYVSSWTSTCRSLAFLLSNLPVVWQNKCQRKPFMNACKLNNW